MELFRKAITENLKETSSLKRLPFKVGAAKIIPTEFGLEDGMGPGGITAVTVEVGNQKFAYVTIDGNNMVSGLREKILSMFRDLGVDSGEVFTTDTHAVTAVVLTSRGYHALGEVIPHEKLINYVRETVEKALMDMKPAKVGYKVTTVPNVKVIGEKQIIELCSLIDPALKRAKHMAVPLFLATGLLLVFLLVWLL
jgi:predicted neutral ceramidase superfamily lipid hydrolase